MNPRLRSRVCKCCWEYGLCCGVYKECFSCRDRCWWSSGCDVVVMCCVVYVYVYMCCVMFCVFKRC